MAGLKLTRAQLAAFLKDHESIKQFEKLFTIANNISDNVVEEIGIQAANADAKANMAISLILADDPPYQPQFIQDTTFEKSTRVLTWLSM